MIPWAGTGNQGVTMTRILSTAVVAALLAVGVTGCGGGGGGGGGDIAGDVCRRADSCSGLSGISAAQCKDLINTSLTSMSGPARSSAENAYRACLGLSDCAGYNTCVVGVMQGSTTGTGGSAAGGTGGGAIGS